MVIDSLFLKLRQIFPKYEDAISQQCTSPHPPQGCQCQVRKKWMEDVSLTSLGEGVPMYPPPQKSKVGFRDTEVGQCFRIKATLDYVRPLGNVPPPPSRIFFCFWIKATLDYVKPLGNVPTPSPQIFA